MHVGNKPISLEQAIEYEGDADKAFYTLHNTWRHIDHVLTREEAIASGHPLVYLHTFDHMTSAFSLQEHLLECVAFDFSGVTYKYDDGYDDRITFDLPSDILLELERIEEALESLLKPFELFSYHTAWVVDISALVEPTTPICGVEIGSDFYTKKDATLSDRMTLLSFSPCGRYAIAWDNFSREAITFSSDIRVLLPE